MSLHVNKYASECDARGKEGMWGQRNACPLAHRVVHGKLSHFGENTWGVDFKHHINLILVHYIT